MSFQRFENGAKPARRMTPKASAENTSGHRPKGHRRNVSNVSACSQTSFDSPPSPPRPLKHDVGSGGQDGPSVCDYEPGAVCLHCEPASISFGLDAPFIDDDQSSVNWLEPA